MRPFLLRDQKFMNNIVQMGMEITPHLNNPNLNNPNTSPQQLLNNFSEQAQSLAQKQSKIKIGIIKSKIKKLENTRDILINKTNSLENNERSDTLYTTSTSTTTILLERMPRLVDLLSHKLNAALTYNEIESALTSSPNDKAAGTNRIPTDLYKEIHKLHKQNAKVNKPSLDIINLLKAAYTDLETNGVTAPNFQNGWLCPLYKKSDCREIPNYRPIMVLNSEYKILTTAIMTRLAEAAPNLIHKTQATFISGCSIFDQINLAKCMIDLCHLKNQNGAIILLDQEKAYDKINHNYLWSTLDTASIPPKLINTIKALYTNATTRVILNGHTSKKFTVERGVCQGNPLSCLLFNFAIEPLSLLIRSSPQIKGLNINIPSASHNVTLSLFTDDAAIFLAKDNSPMTLFNHLDEWCLSLGAKFNKNKTVVIPVRSPNYRRYINESRKLNLSSDFLFDNSIHILKDGESTRYLGAHLGNQISGNEPWPRIINDIEGSLKQWDKAYPSIEGRKHIVQMVIGGKSQFITAAQGMPSKYEDYLNKRIRTFLWNSDAPPPIATTSLSDNHQKGSIKALDIRARNKAINIMKLKKLADYSPECPPASDAALEIILACSKPPNSLHPEHSPTLLY